MTGHLPPDFDGLTPEHHGGAEVPDKRIVHVAPGAASVAIALLTSAPVNSQTQPAPSQAPNTPPTDLCDTPGHHQFDFWVGRWDVYRAKDGTLAAHSVIEKLYNGCAIRENWMPLHGFGGGSLNSYRPGERRWRQVWVDSGNEVHEYSGTFDGGALIFVGKGIDNAGAATTLRMTFKPNPDGSVVQTGEKSSDGGKTWNPEYQFVYRPAAARPERG